MDVERRIRTIPILLTVMLVITGCTLARPSPSPTAPSSESPSPSGDSTPTTSPSPAASPTPPTPSTPPADALTGAQVQELFDQSDEPLPLTIDEFHDRYDQIAVVPTGADTLVNSRPPPDYSWLDAEFGVAITGLAHADGSPRMLAISYLNGLRRPSGEHDERDLYWNFSIRAFVEAASPGLSEREADRVVVELLGFAGGGLRPDTLIDYWSESRRNTVVKNGIRYDLASTDDATHWLIVTAVD